MNDSPNKDAGAQSAAQDRRAQHIRSFAMRRGHFTAGQRDAYERLRPSWCLPYARHRLDAGTVFGRQAALVLEIGCGMGETTAAIAQAMPQTDFIGIEVYPAGVGSLLRLIEEQQLRNLRVIEHDAVEVIRDMIAPGQLDAVHVFFPDPWHKKRHHKRRLLQAGFVTMLASRIRSGGYLHCATDWAPYAIQMLEVLAAEPQLENTAAPVRLDADIARCEGFAPRPDYRTTTKFERRGIGLGHGVWDLVFRRR